MSWFNYKKRFVWDDIKFPVSNVKAIPGKEATEQVYRGGIVLKFESGTDNGIAFNVQLPHSYKLGTDLDYHIHYILPVAGAGAGVENMKWDLTYSWASIGTSMPTEVTLTNTVDVQNFSADTHYIFDIGDVLRSNANLNVNMGGVSQMLICSLTRDTTVANNYGSDIYLMESDFHIQKDTLGSKSEYTK